MKTTPLLTAVLCACAALSPAQQQTLDPADNLPTARNKLNASLTALFGHAASTANPHAVTKGQVGLGNVDNTSDANKPISTAVQTALALKQPLSPALSALAQFAPDYTAQADTLVLRGNSADILADGFTATPTGAGFVVGASSLTDTVLTTGTVNCTSIDAGTLQGSLDAADLTGNIDIARLPTSALWDAANLTGTLDLARLPAGSSNGQVLKWTGTAWAAGNDLNTLDASLLIAGTLPTARLPASVVQTGQVGVVTAAMLAASSATIGSTSVALGSTAPALAGLTSLSVGSGTTLATITPVGNGTRISGNGGEYINYSSAGLVLGQWPVVARVRAPSAGAGNTNRAGADIEIIAGTNTGNQAGGSVTVWTSPAGASGGTEGTLTKRVTVNSSGHVILHTLPTSAAGLASGTLWSDAGTLRVAP